MRSKFVRIQTLLHVYSADHMCRTTRVINVAAELQRVKTWHRRLRHVIPGPSLQVQHVAPFHKSCENLTATLRWNWKPGEAQEAPRLLYAGQHLEPNSMFTASNPDLFVLDVFDRLLTPIYHPSKKNETATHAKVQARARACTPGQGLAVVSSFWPG